jgi:hypothetical protein
MLTWQGSAPGKAARAQLGRRLLVITTMLAGGIAAAAALLAAAFAGAASPRLRVRFPR